MWKFEMRDLSLLPLLAGGWNGIEVKVTGGGSDEVEVDVDEDEVEPDRFRDISYLVLSWG